MTNFSTSALRRENVLSVLDGIVTIELTRPRVLIIMAAEVIRDNIDTQFAREMISRYLFGFEDFRSIEDIFMEFMDDNLIKYILPLI